MQDIHEAKASLPVREITAAIGRQLTSALHLGPWNAWREKSVNRRIFGAMITVGGLTCIVKVVATLKEVIIAGQYGVSDEFDAFLIAYLLPSFAINVVAGSFNAALIPTYIQVRERQGNQEAQKLLSSVMVASLTLLIIVSILLGLAVSHIVTVLGSGFSPEKRALTRSLFLILLAILPLTGIATIGAAILNSGERFALAAMTPIITPVVVIVAVRELAAAWGVYAIAAAIIVGAMIECALLARSLWRQGISLMPRWRGMTPATKQVMKQYVPMIAGCAAMNSTVLVDQSMAAMLGPGSVSVLSYGNKVSSVVASLGAVALSTAVLPQFSRMVALCDWRGIRHTLKTYTRLVLSITVPVTLAFVLLSKPIISLLFERGAFTSNDADQVASVQSLYALQLPFYVLGMMFVRLISAFKANQVLMWGTAINFVVNITLDYLLMRWIGVSGIAFSTSVVYIISLCYLLLMSLPLLKRMERQECA